MLDRRFIRENSDAVRVAVRVKGINLDVDELLSLDHASRELQRELDGAHTRRKRFSRVPDGYAMAALDLRWLHAPVAWWRPDFRLPSHARRSLVPQQEPRQAPPDTAEVPRLDA